ncbi:MAG TPA: hypothetical protein PLQ41_06705 [bacterium]|nr:hypothetical protein [bacterium]
MEKKQKIMTHRGKFITRDGIFKRKEEFHKKQAKLPFEEKIKILMELQEIADNIKNNYRNKYKKVRT